MLQRKTNQGKVGRESQGGEYCFIWVVRVGLNDNATFEQRPKRSEEISHADIWWNIIPGRRNRVVDTGLLLGEHSWLQPSCHPLDSSSHSYGGHSSPESLPASGWAELETNSGLFHEMGTPLQAIVAQKHPIFLPGTSLGLHYTLKVSCGILFSGPLPHSCQTGTAV